MIPYSKNYEKDGKLMKDYVKQNTKLEKNVVNVRGDVPRVIKQEIDAVLSPDSSDNYPIQQVNLEQKEFMQKYLKSKEGEDKFDGIDLNDFFEYINHQIEVESKSKGYEQEYRQILKEFLEEHEVIVNI